MVKRVESPNSFGTIKMNSRTGRIRLGFDGEIDEDVTGSVD